MTPTLAFPMRLGPRRNRDRSTGIRTSGAPRSRKAFLVTIVTALELAGLVLTMSARTIRIVRS